jgi:hypothetical protein
VDHAPGTECRKNATQAKAESPAGGRYLEWANPPVFPQQDLFLLRRRRVYRVSVVQPGVSPTVSKEKRQAGFDFIEFKRRSSGRWGSPGAGRSTRHLVAPERGR